MSVFFSTAHITFLHSRRNFSRLAPGLTSGQLASEACPRALPCPPPPEPVRGRTTVPSSLIKAGLWHPLLDSVKNWINWNQFNKQSLSAYCAEGTAGRRGRRSERCLCKPQTASRSGSQEKGPGRPVPGASEDARRPHVDFWPLELGGMKRVSSEAAQFAECSRNRRGKLIPLEWGRGLISLWE